MQVAAVQTQRQQLQAAQQLMASGTAPAAQASAAANSQLDKLQEAVGDIFAGL